MPNLKEKVKLPAYTRIDVWIFFLIVPVQVVLCNSFILGEAYLDDLKIFLTASGIFMVVMFFTFQLCGVLALKFLKWFPDVKDIPKRLFLSVLCYISLTMISVSLIMFIFHFVPLLNFQDGEYFNKWAAIASAIGNVIITIVFEAVAAFERWKATLTETEQLKKENLKSQLQSLKNQINPHFLFNSINSLSSLISDDPDKAELFLDEMSKVYRYLLRNNEDNLITLRMELDFIHSYFHLLKTRYGDGIELNLNIPERLLDRSIPPLTLQILIENAVKHNVILKDHPLKMDITPGKDDKLMVSNNLQRKKTRVMSNKVGLENIAAKYRLMNQPEIEISENENMFCVIVPLI